MKIQALLPIAILACKVFAARAADPLATWRTRVSPTNATIPPLTSRSNRVDALGTGVSLASPHGVTWTMSTNAHNVATFGVAFGNTPFLAIGRSGRVQTSPDGVAWPRRTSGTPAHFSSVNYGHNLSL